MIPIVSVEFKKKLREISTEKEDEKWEKEKNCRAGIGLASLKRTVFFVQEKIALKINFILITIDGTVRLLET